MTTHLPSDLRLPLYWHTPFGSLCERQTGPDSDSWAAFRRLSDGAIREWLLSDMSPVSDAEAIAESAAALAS